MGRRGVHDLDVQVLFSLRKVCSQCRLCLIRHTAGEFNVYIKAYDGHQTATYYCPECYGYLRQRALEEVAYPEISMLALKGKSGLEITVPMWLVKDRDPLKLYYPEPLIDLPLYRKRKLDRIASGGK